MTDKQIIEEIKHINKRNQEYIAENNRMTEKIIDGLSCDNCPDAQRCQEQQTKKEYAINQVLQDIPSEYANVIDRLKQIIPSITRCDYVLEKQLKRKEQECEELKKQVEIFTRQLEKANKEVIKEKEKNATQRQKNEKLEQTLTEIKEIAKNMNNECFYDDFNCEDCDMENGCTYFNKKQILQKISECEVK